MWDKCIASVIRGITKGIDHGLFPQEQSTLGNEMVFHLCIIATVGKLSMRNTEKLLWGNEAIR